MFQQRFPIPRNFGLGGLRPCNHCKLIDSGDVAMYGVTCPECGEVPPSKKHMYPNFNANVKCYFHKCNNKLRNLITDWLNITKNVVMITQSLNIKNLDKVSFVQPRFLTN